MGSDAAVGLTVRVYDGDALACRHTVALRGLADDVPVFDAAAALRLEESITSHRVGTAIALRGARVDDRARLHCVHRFVRRTAGPPEIGPGVKAAWTPAIRGCDDVASSDGPVPGWPSICGGRGLFERFPRDGVDDAIVLSRSCVR